MQPSPYLRIACLAAALFAPLAGSADISVTIRQDGARDGLYHEPGSTGAVRIVVRNDGTEAVEGLALDFTGAAVTLSPAAGGAWRQEDGRLRAGGIGIAPGGAIVLDAAVAVPDAAAPAMPTGGVTTLTGSVTSTGERFTARTRWLIDSCPVRYHRALRLVKARRGGALEDAVVRAARPDPTLPRSFVFDLPDGVRADRGALNAVARSLRARLADSEMRGADMKWLTGRLGKDISTYLDQPAIASLCTGVTRWTGIMKRQAKYLDGRINARMAIDRRLRPFTRAAVADARDALGLMGEPADTALGAADRLADMFLEAGKPIGGGYGAFDTAKAALSSPALDWNADIRGKVTGAAALLERQYYLERQRAHSGLVADALDGTLADVRAAHAEHCTCR